jgi:UDP-glucose 4-epimerase
VFASRGLDVAVLRLANVYGPRDRGRVIPIFLENAVSGVPLKLNGGEQMIDFVWIEDVVDALCRAGLGAKLPGPVNIGSGKGTSIRELARRTLELTGAASRVEVAPANAVEVVHFVADTSQARRLWGVGQPADPLSHLPEVLHWIERQATATVQEA